MNFCNSAFVPGSTHSAILRTVATAVRVTALVSLPAITTVRDLGWGCHRHGRLASARCREYVNLRSTAAAVGGVPGGAEDAAPVPIPVPIPVPGGADPGRERERERGVAAAVGERGDDAAGGGSLASGAVPDLPARFACSSWSW